MPSPKPVVKRDQPRVVRKGTRPQALAEEGWQATESLVCAWLLAIVLWPGVFLFQLRQQPVSGLFSSVDVYLLILAFCNSVHCQLFRKFIWIGSCWCAKWDPKKHPLEMTTSQVGILCHCLGSGRGLALLYPFSLHLLRILCPLLHTCLWCEWLQQIPLTPAVTDPPADAGFATCCWDTCHRP